MYPFTVLTLHPSILQQSLIERQPCYLRSGGGCLLRLGSCPHRPAGATRVGARNRRKKQRNVPGNGGRRDCSVREEVFRRERWGRFLKNEWEVIGCLWVRRGQGYSWDRESPGWGWNHSMAGRYRASAEAPRWPQEGSGVDDMKQEPEPAPGDGDAREDFTWRSGTIRSCILEGQPFPVCPGCIFPSFPWFCSRPHMTGWKHSFPDALTSSVAICPSPEIQQVELPGKLFVGPSLFLPGTWT